MWKLDLIEIVFAVFTVGSGLGIGEGGALAQQPEARDPRHHDESGSTPDKLPMQAPATSNATESVGIVQSGLAAKASRNPDELAVSDLFRSNADTTAWDASVSTLLNEGLELSAEHQHLNSPSAKDQAKRATFVAKAEMLLQQKVEALRHLEVRARLAKSILQLSKSDQSKARELHDQGRVAGIVLSNLEKAVAIDECAVETIQLQLKQLVRKIEQLQVQKHNVQVILAAQAEAQSKRDTPPKAPSAANVPNDARPRLLSLLTVDQVVSLKSVDGFYDISILDDSDLKVFREKFDRFQKEIESATAESQQAEGQNPALTQQRSSRVEEIVSEWNNFPIPFKIVQVGDDFVRFEPVTELARRDQASWIAISQSAIRQIRASKKSKPMGLMEDPCSGLPSDIDQRSQLYGLSAPVSRYTVSASTTGHGKPPKIGGYADIFTNIHDLDPTDPEVQPLVRRALVTNTFDLNPNVTSCRVVKIELELTQSEIDRIKNHEYRNSFTFYPVDGRVAE